MKIKAFVAAVMLAISVFAVAQCSKLKHTAPADGSDPMPICRPLVKKCM